MHLHLFAYRFIRDRLHESSSFFRLWPSQLQQLLCRLVQARQWLQHEVLAAAGSKPEELCFILEGQVRTTQHIHSVPGRSDSGARMYVWQAHCEAPHTSSWRHWQRVLLQWLLHQPYG